MPEGHTLHRIARLHHRRFAGSPVVVSSPQGRFSEGAAVVHGRVLQRSEAWGKHLLHRYGPDLTVHVHLGLYGTFAEFPLPVPAPVGAVRMRMVGPQGGADLRGPTACEVLSDDEVMALVARLGPDPLRKDARPDLAWQKISQSDRAIGELLMDQKVMAGVGNVYRAEVLFRHHINPYRSGKSLLNSDFDNLWQDLV
ncbi:MAG: Fpg/Nei family DNA glycosylase, partial [Mycobacteriaceae bacterium]